MLTKEEAKVRRGAKLAGMYVELYGAVMQHGPEKFSAHIRMVYNGMDEMIIRSYEGYFKAEDSAQAWCEGAISNSRLMAVGEVA